MFTTCFKHILEKFKIYPILLKAVIRLSFCYLAMKWWKIGEYRFSPSQAAMRWVMLSVQ